MQVHGRICGSAPNPQSPRVPQHHTLQLPILSVLDPSFLLNLFPSRRHTSTQLPLRGSRSARRMDGPGERQVRTCCKLMKLTSFTTSLHNPLTITLANLPSQPLSLTTPFTTRLPSQPLSTTPFNNVPQPLSTTSVNKHPPLSPPPLPFPFCFGRSLGPCHLLVSKGLQEDDKSITIRLLASRQFVDAARAPNNLVLEELHDSLGIALD